MSGASAEGSEEKERAREPGPGPRVCSVGVAIAAARAMEDVRFRRLLPEEGRRARRGRRGRRGCWVGGDEDEEDEKEGREGKRHRKGKRRRRGDDRRAFVRGLTAAPRNLDSITTGATVARGGCFWRGERGSGVAVLLVLVLVGLEGGLLGSVPSERGQLHVLQ